MKKIKLTIDTNVWLSGLVFGGKPGKIIELFVDGAVLIVVSEEVLGELRRKITQKFPLYTNKLSLLESSIRSDGQIVQLGWRVIAVCRDPDDNKFIETAVLGGCNYIVSGDKDLLDLKNYEGIKIMA